MFFESLSGMDPEFQKQVVLSMGKIGAVGALALSAVGSALGCGAAGQAAVGAWKKCYAQNRMAPFMLVAFIGAPLTQTIYGMITMGAIVRNAGAEGALYYNLLVGGLLAGLAMGMSAWMQGKAAAAASDALADTGKGFVNYLIALGMIETVALFVMAFAGKAIA